MDATIFDAPAVTGRIIGGSEIRSVSCMTVQRRGVFLLTMRQTDLAWLKAITTC
jgi:hypothetical protein